MGAGEIVGSLASNFDFHNVWVSVVMFFLVIGTVGFGGFWFWFKKMQFKYHFEILDSHGNSTFKKAKLVKNQQGIRKFCIQGFESPEQWQSISIEPKRIINGVKYRQVAFDGSGNLVAIDGFKLHKEKYIETSLTEVEKTVQAYSILEANQDHNILDKAQKWQIGVIAILCVFMFLMLFFEVKGIVQVTQSAADTAASLNKAGDKLVLIAESLDRRTDMEALLYRQAFGDNFSMEIQAR